MRAGSCLPVAARGVIVFVIVRRRAGLPILGRMSSVELELPEFAEVPYGTIIVPCKQAGPIEDEMLATACKLAQPERAQGHRAQGDRGAARPSRSTVAMPEEDIASEQLEALCRSFAADYDLEVECRVLRGSRDLERGRARGARGRCRVDPDRRGPHPWDAAGRAHVFSDTVENLLRRAHCRVIVTSFPAGTASLDEDRHTVIPATV